MIEKNMKQKLPSILKILKFIVPDNKRFELRILNKVCMKPIELS